MPSTRSTTWLLALLATALVAQGVGAVERDPNSSVANLWAELDEVREYRSSFPVQRSHELIADDYETDSSDLGDVTPRAKLEELIPLFTAAASTSEPVEGALGLREALNEYMLGQKIIGAEDLLDALRVRFPGIDTGGFTTDQLLEMAQGDFAAGIELGVAALASNPEIFRTGDPNTLSSLYEDNSNYHACLPSEGTNLAPLCDPGAPTTCSPSQTCTMVTGEQVTNEVFNLTELVVDYAEASNNRAARAFLDADLDVSPAPPIPPLEFAVGLAEASAQTTYLSAIALSVLQSEAEFQRNHGHLLKRYVLTAQQIVDDIRSGFDPNSLKGDFIPAVEAATTSIRTTAEMLVSDAVADEQALTAASRTVDVDQTTLEDRLQALREGYRDELAALTGLDPNAIEMNYGTLSTREDRDRLRADADDQTLGRQGELGSKLFDIELAVLEVERLNTRMAGIAEQIRAEEAAVGEINRLTIEGAEDQAAVLIANAVAELFQICACGLSSGQEFNPGTITSAVASGALLYRDTLRTVQLNGISSGQTVLALLIEQADLLVSSHSAQIRLEQEQLRYDGLLDRFERAMQNYAVQTENFANAYFNNPAYRLYEDQQRIDADNAFNAAKLSAYVWAKTLEYVWSEDFRNPVMSSDGTGTSISLEPQTPFRIAESAFAASSAGAPGAPSPGLDNFMSSLQVWDSWLRTSLPSQPQTQRTPAPSIGDNTWSLKFDIEKLGSFNVQQSDAAFAAFIAANIEETGGVRRLVVEFEAPIVDPTPGALIPGTPIPGGPAIQPNQKITSIAINVKERPGPTGLFIVQPGQSEPTEVNVEVHLEDEASVRTFFANASQDDTLDYRLRSSRPGETPPNNATVMAGVDTFGTDSMTLAGIAPAVTTWRLLISEQNNPEIVLEGISDIEIKVDYSFGRPNNIF